MTIVPGSAQERLLDDTKAMRYLCGDRGLTEETICSAGLGLSQERITVPITDAAGKVVATRRYSRTSEPKWTWEAGSKASLWLRPGPGEPWCVQVILTEGEFDCLVAGQHFSDTTCATGTAGAGWVPKEDDLETLRGVEVVVVYDCDAAGRAGAAKVAAVLDGVAASVKVVDLGLGNGEDLTDWFVTHGRSADDLRALIAETPPYDAALAAAEPPAPSATTGADEPFKPVAASARRSVGSMLGWAVGRCEAVGRRQTGIDLACQLRDERYTRDEAEPVMRVYAAAVTDLVVGKAYTVETALASLTSGFSREPREPSGVGAVTDRSRFALISPGELALPVPPMEWLIKGLWPAGSYGPWGGAKKTLKTYTATLAAVAVAAGVPAFGMAEWAVPRAQPVIYFGGEGGRSMHMRRLQRVAEFYGVDLAEIPFYLVTDVGPFNSPEFRTAARQHIEGLGAGLMVLDSLYNYHPANVEATNLYERGRLLGGLSALTTDLGCAAWVVDHFNKNGSGIDLDRLAQAGMAAWADSWALWEHASDPDVPAGRFTLNAGIGSRQWGGDEHTVHLDIGAYDVEASTYLSPIKVDVTSGHVSRARGGEADKDVAGEVLNLVRDNPAIFTKSALREDIKKILGVGAKRVEEEIERLLSTAQLVSAKGKVPTASGVGRTYDLLSVGSGRLHVKTTVEP